jgi:hypothetical protein
VSEAPLIWDGCGLLNLAATARDHESLASLNCPSYVVTEVRKGEVPFLRPLPEEDPQGKLVSVDLSDLFAAGLLQEITLTAAEEELFVQYAREVDDGEARTAAAAVSRGLRVVIDDRGAIRLLGSLEASPPVLTTPEWLKHWADIAQVTEEVVGSVLRRVELCSRYRPRRTHLLYDWWQDHVVLVE